MDESNNPRADYEDEDELNDEERKAREIRENKLRERRLAKKFGRRKMSVTKRLETSVNLSNGRTLADQDAGAKNARTKVHNELANRSPAGPVRHTDNVSTDDEDGVESEDDDLAVDPRPAAKRPQSGAWGDDEMYENAIDPSEKKAIVDRQKELRERRLAKKFGRRKMSVTKRLETTLQLSNGRTLAEQDDGQKNARVNLHDELIARSPGKTGFHDGDASTDEEGSTDNDDDDAQLDRVPSNVAFAEEPLKDDELAEGSEGIQRISKMYHNSPQNKQMDKLMKMTGRRAVSIRMELSVIPPKKKTGLNADVYKAPSPAGSASAAAAAPGGNRAPPSESSAPPPSIPPKGKVPVTNVPPRPKLVGADAMIQDIMDRVYDDVAADSLCSDVLCGGPLQLFGNKKSKRM